MLNGRTVFPSLEEAERSALRQVGDSDQVIFVERENFTNVSGSPASCFNLSESMSDSAVSKVTRRGFVSLDPQVVLVRVSV